MNTSIKTFKISNTEIEVVINLDNVIDYNKEYGFSQGDEEFIENWICANVIVEIGDDLVRGQVQYDSYASKYSIDCDGNGFYDDVKNIVLSQFNEDELANEDGVESNLHCDLINDTIPEICKMICDFGKKAINGE